MLPLPAPLREAIDARGSGLTVLVLRLGAMGDVVRTLPAVRLLRSGLPEARLYWAAWKPWTGILEGHPDLDGIVGLPRSELRALARSPFTWPSLVRVSSRIAAEVRALDAGLVVDFHGDFRTGLLGLISGAPVRLGYDGHQQKEGNRLFTTLRVPAGDRRTPRPLRNLDLVAALGLAVRPVPGAGIAIGPGDVLAAATIVRELLPGEGEYAVLNPGASRRQAYKKPPVRLFAAAARALAERRVCPLVVFGPGEEAEAARVVAASDGVARLTPETTLKSLAALLQKARVFVGGDSGPLHLACGVGCPVLGLYGPTDPTVNTPWNVPFVALSDPKNRYTGIKSDDRAVNGFAGLDPEAVIGAIDDLLRQARSTA